MPRKKTHSKESFLPPLALARNAEEGLMLRKKFGRGGTMVGIARARDLKNRKKLSLNTVKRMYSFFARHYVDKQGKNFYNPDKPSNGYIAWQLWGGDEGASWAYDTYKVLKRKEPPAHT